MTHRTGEQFGRPWPERPTSTRTRGTDSGIARAPGLAVAAVSAAIVVAIGMALFPVHKKASPEPEAPPAVAPTPPPSSMAVADAAAAAATAAPEAGVVAAKAADAGAAVAGPDAGRTAVSEKVAAEPEPAKPSEESESATSPAAKAIDKQKQADRDLAREAWRRNRPDISIAGAKTSILIPIKGSIKGADFKISDKRRLVTVTLPKAVSMVTMRVYNLKHPSFKKLWIDQDEANAQPADGTKMRLILGQTLDPQVEITDDFVRVTIRRPDSDEAPAEPRAEKRAKKAVEKRPEPSEETAPEKENE